jgi:hypothetical protein
VLEVFVREVRRDPLAGATLPEMLDMELTPAQAAALPIASVVALAPAAMSALIEAQEHMAGDPTSTDLDLTARKIDHLLARLTDAPAARPAGQAAVAAGGFSVQMLIAVRQQLRETVA